MLVYDISNSSSFANVENWIKEIEMNAGNIPIILIGNSKLFSYIGNKCDLEDKRQVSFEEGQAFADEYGLPLIELKYFI